MSGRRPRGIDQGAHPARHAGRGGRWTAGVPVRPGPREPGIQQAIDYESGRDAAQHALDMAAGASTDHEGAGVVSRAVQASAGIGVAVVFFGMAMGALFAVAYSSAAASS